MITAAAALTIFFHFCFPSFPSWLFPVIKEGATILLHLPAPKQRFFGCKSFKTLSSETGLLLQTKTASCRFSEVYRSMQAAICQPSACFKTKFRHNS